MSDHNVQILAEDVIALRTDTASAAQALAAHLRQSQTWLEVVPGLDSVALRFDLSSQTLDTAIYELESAASAAQDRFETAPIGLEIPLQYGGTSGPDLPAICDQLGLSEADFITRHSRQVYPVAMIGFIPGFAYLSGLDPSLSRPRLGQPRRHVPAGSVGISGLLTGVYTLKGPGGWPLIGRTDLSLFRPQENDPFVIHPGMLIRFIPE